MFRTIRLTAAALTVAVAGLALAGSASAHARGIPYEFRGTAVVAPGTGATQLQVQVTGGDRVALKALLGAAQPTTFTADAKTRWLAVQGNTPVLGASDTVLAGDLVRVVVRAPRHTADRHARRDAGRQRDRPLGQDAPQRPAVPVRRDGVGDRHDRAHHHGRRELRQLARALRPARPARAPDVHLRLEHRLPEVAPRRADRRRAERHPRRRPAHAARLRARPGTRRSPACSPLRSGGSSSASRCASRCATAPRCPPPDHHPRGPLTPHPISRGPPSSRASPSPRGAGLTAGPAVVGGACSLLAWSDCGHRGA